MLLLENTKKEVTQLLVRNIPKQYQFHHLDHTLNVVNAVKIIGKYEKVPPMDQHVLLIAAWFHDTGYTRIYFGHEEESIRIVTHFLEKEDHPELIDPVTRCIAATKPAKKPGTRVERILRDADTFHISMDDYWETNEMLRKEINFISPNNMDRPTWLGKNLSFLQCLHFYTPFGKRVLEPKRVQRVKENKQIIQNIKRPN